MAIKRYYAEKDTTITNAFKKNLITRGTGSNMGESDILEVFSIYGQASTSSLEAARALVQFDIASLKADRDLEVIPASGSVSFYLRMFNAKHSQTLPSKFYLEVKPVTSEWEEGYGLDMENYRDAGAANWAEAQDGISWSSEGGDYSSDVAFRKVQYFERGYEDLEVDITNIVEDQIGFIEGAPGATLSNYGYGVFLTSSQESSDLSYFTKKFFARGSEFFYKKPVLEARWDSSVLDDRANFYYSSSLAPAEDNLNNLYLYNFVRGRLTNIPSVGSGSIYVSLYSGSLDNSAPSGSKLALSAGGGVNSSGDFNATGSFYKTGIYKVSLALTGTATDITKLFDVWHFDGVEYSTGSILPKDLDAQYSSYTPNNLIKITNLKSSYSVTETPRLRVFNRQKNRPVNIYTVATSVVPNDIVDSSYYKVERAYDGLEVISYGTGSSQHTKLSYDASGSYFDLDMSLFEPGYMYTIKIAQYLDSRYKELPETFKFRVD